MTDRPPRRAPRPLGFTIGSWLLALFLIPAAILMLMPFIWMISTSLKSAGAVFTYPPEFIPRPPQWSMDKSRG